MQIWQMIVIGRVQGVGFRYAVNRFVMGNIPRLRGYVRNLPDGSVEIVATGELEDLSALYAFAKEGPRLAVVERVELDTKFVMDLERLGEGFTIWQS